MSVGDEHLGDLYVNKGEEAQNQDIINLISSESDQDSGLEQAPPLFSEVELIGSSRRPKVCSNAVSLPGISIRSIQNRPTAEVGPSTTLNAKVVEESAFHPRNPFPPKTFANLGYACRVPVHQLSPCPPIVWQVWEKGHCPEFLI